MLPFIFYVLYIHFLVQVQTEREQISEQIKKEKKRDSEMRREDHGTNTERRKKYMNVKAIIFLIVYKKML